MTRRSRGLTNLQLPTSDVNAAPLVGILVNPEWQAVLLSIASLLEDVYIWEDGVDQDRVEQQAFNLYKQIRNAGAIVYPKHAACWHYQARIVTGGAMTTISLASPPDNIPNGFFNILSYQSTYASTDSFEQDIFLAAGDYNFGILCGKNEYGGLLDWYLDGNLFWQGKDFYNSAVQINIIESHALTVLTSGNHVLKGVVNGTSSPAGTYFVPLINYWFSFAP